MKNKCSRDSPRGTQVSRHNPARSLKVRSGRTLGAGAASPGPSRSPLGARLGSPRSFRRNECQPYIPFSGVYSRVF